MTPIVGLVAVAHLLVIGTVAWSDKGYEAAYLTTLSSFDSKQSSQIKRLFGYKDYFFENDFFALALKHLPFLSEAVNGGFPKTACDSQDPGKPQDTGKQYKSRLTTTIKHLVGKVTRSAASPESETMLRFDQIKVLDELADTDKLLLVAALTIELHQPMRFLKAGALNHGELLKIEWQRGGPNPSAGFFFDYFDYDAIRDMIADNPMHWDSGWTHVRSLGEPLVEAESSSFKEKGLDAIETAWSQSVLGLSCEAWKSVETVCPSVLAQEESGPALTLPACQLPSHLVQRIRQMIQTQLLLAGLRAGLLVKFLLSKMDEPSLRNSSPKSFADAYRQDASGDTVKTLPGGSASGRPTPSRKTSEYALLINIGLLVVVSVGFGLYMFGAAGMRSGLQTLSRSLQGYSGVPAVGHDGQVELGSGSSGSSGFHPPQKNFKYNE